MIDTVYIVLDTTEEETYHHLGTFATLIRALDAIAEVEKNLPPPVYFENSQPDTWCKVDINEVLLDDWSDLGKNVATIEWALDQEGNWRRI